MAQFDLALCLQESARGISGILNYASDLFDVATVERWVECFKTVLREMVSQPQRPVSRLPLMRDDERRRIVELFNETQVAYPTGKLIHELFQEQVERAPEALALTYGERQLTYRQLNSRANRLAHALSARGLRPDERVALCMARGVEMIIGLLGILKAGGAYVPLDGSYPAERLRFMVEDSAPIIVITQEALKDVLPTGDIPVVVLDMDSDEIREKPDTNVMAARIGLRPQHLASIIYTSGSTGRPKGVMVEHAGLCNLAYMQMQSFDVQPGSRVLQFASLSFDACTWECLMALCSGACLCIASREELAPGEPLLRTLRAQNVTHATLPPVALAALPEGSDLRLKTLIVAGEPCPVSLAQKWGSGRCFINAYGPTEATVCASIHQYAPSDSGSLPIGRPIPNTQIYILDKHDQPVPIGVIGEIHIGGVGVTRGYWNRTELTSQRFVGDPFRGNGSGRMYRTGDLGRWRIDGTIEFVGRNDHQVKLRGFRIELGEIEVQLLRHTQVKEAVVVAREDVQNDKRLVAYVVVNRTSGSQMALSVEDLRMHLATVLPEHMIPSAFVMLEAVPLTPNGKVNRQALPVPGSTAYVRQYYEPPLGNEEQVLAGIWQSLLRVERIGRHDNFFELGGHSLLATRVVARIRELLHVELPLKALFETPKLAQLAARIAAEVHGQAANEALRASSLGQEIGDMPDDAVFAKIADLERELGYSDQ
jgi:amino acid adenylation domain-containing protein